jgi:hypothetical protein
MGLDNTGLDNTRLDSTGLSNADALGRADGQPR